MRFDPLNDASVETSPRLGFLGRAQTLQQALLFPHRRYLAGTFRAPIEVPVTSQPAVACVATRKNIL